MTSRSQSDMDLERSLREHYRAIAPPADPRLPARISDAIDAFPARNRGHVRMQLAAAAAVLVLAAASLIVPRMLPAIAPNEASPLAGPTSSGPGFDATKALGAAVGGAGEIRAGGLWAVTSDYLLLSTDGGATWKASHVPLPVYAIDVLDASHAWTVSAGSYRAAVAASWAGMPSSTSPPLDSIVVNRTTDGGASWTSVRLDRGNCDTVELSFVDAQRGFLMCRGNAGSTDTSPAATIFGTADGGATWSVVRANVSLGPDLLALDASTLWTSAPNGRSSSHLAPMVSRDGGRTWTAVSLPDAASLADDQGVQVSATAIDWEGQIGTLAADIVWYGQARAPQVWFYRTPDGGRTWTVTKVDRHMASMGLEYEYGAVAGPVWAILSDNGFESFRVSYDLGKSWTSFDCSGMPSNIFWGWMGLSDAGHGEALVFDNDAHSYVLMITSDGGRSWLPADFGNARAQVSPVPSTDAATAEQTANDFQVFVTKDPTSAWLMLSEYSQAAYGSEAAFETRESALARGSNYAFDVGPAVRDATVLSESGLGSAMWSNLQSTAIVDRAYVVALTYSTGPVSRRLLVVAPLAASGEWRVWVVGTGSGS